MRVNTIYFGGGDALAFIPAAVADVLAAVRTHFNLLADVEVTLEANPGAVGREGFGAPCGRSV